MLFLEGIILPTKKTHLLVLWEQTHGIDNCYLIFELFFLGVIFLKKTKSQQIKEKDSN